ncbi:MAG: hypothetical protein ACFFEV_01275 [Candidatus Thorarchaeota archaeon]
MGRMKWNCRTGWMVKLWYFTDINLELRLEPSRKLLDGRMLATIFPQTEVKGEQLCIACHRNTDFKKILVDNNPIGLEVRLSESNELPYIIAMTDSSVPEKPQQVEIEYSTLMNGYRDITPAFWDGLTSEFIFVRPDEAYYPSPAENPFADYYHGDESISLTIEGPSDWVFATSSQIKPKITKQSNSTRWKFEKVRKPPLLVGGKFNLTKSSKYPNLEFWTLRKDAPSDETLSFVAEVIDYFQSQYGDLSSLMLRYVETPKGYSGYVRQPLILMDEGDMDSVLEIPREKYHSASSDIRYKIIGLVHEIAHLWFPGETIIGPDIGGLWGESFTHVAESGCILNHFGMDLTNIQRFVRQYKRLEDLVDKEPALIHLTRETLEGNAWDPIRRGKAVLILLSMVNLIGWNTYSDVMKQILLIGKEKPVTHQWLWERFNSYLSKEQAGMVKEFQEKFIFNKPSQKEFEELCIGLGLEYTTE